MKKIILLLLILITTSTTFALAADELDVEETAPTETLADIVHQINAINDDEEKVKKK